MPASNMKIVTGATALAQLGPDFTLPHRLRRAAGAWCDDTLQGALIVNGRGDPTISDHMRGDGDEAAVRRRGFAHGARRRRAITGGVLQAAPMPFPTRRIGFGWSWDDLAKTTEPASTRSTSTRDSARAIACGEAGRASGQLRRPFRRVPTRVIASCAPIAAPTLADTHRCSRSDFDPRAHAVHRARTCSRSRGRYARRTSIPISATAYLAALREALVVARHRGTRRRVGHAVGRVRRRAHE